MVAGTIASITLVGSLMSLVATLAVLLSCLVLRREQRSFRHALVINLTIAEFVNAANNSVSGFIYVTRSKLEPGPLCTVNGFVGQLSVQAADFSILAIAVVTVLVIREKAQVSMGTLKSKLILCGSVWVTPLITATTATALGSMTAVGNNWCWISPDRQDLRYALNHGWRLFVILGVVSIYTFVWWHMRLHFKKLALTPTHNPKLLHPSSHINLVPWARKGSVQESTVGEADGDRSPTLSTSPGARGRPTADEDRTRQARSRGRRQSRSKRRSSVQIQASQIDSDAKRYPGTESDTSKLCNDNMPLMSPETNTTHPITPIHRAHYITSIRSHDRVDIDTDAEQFSHAQASQERQREIKRTLLLNAYPIMYVILWAPALINRLLEALGYDEGDSLAQGLQASSQFVGFANAVTYGLNRHLMDKIRHGSLVQRWCGRWHTSDAPATRRRLDSAVS